MDFYLHKINEVGLLPWDKEADIIAAAQDGDLYARDQVIRGNLRLVVHIAKKYMQFCTPGLNFEDLVQEGNLGLMRAVEGYNPSFNTKFVTYAVMWIKQAIRKAILNHRHIIRVPICTQTKSFDYDLETAPTEAIRDAVRVRNMLSADMLTKYDTPTIINTDIDREEDEQELQRQIRLFQEAFAKLTKQEQLIIRERYLREKKLTLKAIGKSIGLTRERVRQIESKAIQKIREYAKAAFLSNSN